MPTLHKLTALLLVLTLPLTMAAMAAHSHLDVHSAGEADFFSECTTHDDHSESHQCHPCTLRYTGSNGTLTDTADLAISTCQTDTGLQLLSQHSATPSLGFDSRGPPTLL